MNEENEVQRIDVILSWNLSSGQFDPKSIYFNLITILYMSKEG
jgi:hypothetical protein